MSEVGSKFGSASGLEKAAALLISLGVDSSSRILQYINEADMERLLLAISESGSILRRFGSKVWKKHMPYPFQE